MLVAQARERDEAAVRELIRRLNPRLFRVARGILGSDAEAEEVLQEAYLSAFSRLDQFRGDARFSTWMTRIVLNAAGMHKRRSRPHEEYDTLTTSRDLRLNPITVKTRLFRARRRLRAALEARLHGGFEAVFPFDGMRCAGMAGRVVERLKAEGRCRSVRKREWKETLTQAP